jgi:hypothetical protein
MNDEAGGHAKWRPIDTAPRDGTWFLAADTNDRADGVPALFAAAFYADDDDLGLVWQAHCGQQVCETPSPTHWRPMPDPPENEK